MERRLGPPPLALLSVLAEPVRQERLLPEEFHQPVRVLEPHWVPWRRRRLRSRL